MSEPEKPPPPSPRLAVALQYDHAGAPRVTAIGRGVAGEKIIEKAIEAGVPLKEDPILAEALSHVELDAEIPEHLYQAVAVVISFVLKIGSRRRTD